MAPSINYVGFGIFFGTVASTVGAVWLWKLLTPTLVINPKCFDWGVLRELTTTGGWVIINHIGAILYLTIDLLVANRMFGAEQSGEFAAVLQLHSWSAPWEARSVRCFRQQSCSTTRARISMD